MKIQYDNQNNRHCHAGCRFRPIGMIDYLVGVVDVMTAKLWGCMSVNFHTPYEIQFAKYFDRRKKGQLFVNFIERVGGLVGIKVVWENTNILSTADWSLVSGSQRMPESVNVCFDTGHIVLGSKNKREALYRIDKFVSKYGQRIKLLHLHINNLRQDLHINNPDKVVNFLGKKRYQKLTNGRWVIFES